MESAYRRGVIPATIDAERIIYDWHPRWVGKITRWLPVKNEGYSRLAMIACIEHNLAMNWQFSSLMLGFTLDSVGSVEIAYSYRADVRWLTMIRNYVPRYMSLCLTCLGGIPAALVPLILAYEAPRCVNILQKTLELFQDPDYSQFDLCDAKDGVHTRKPTEAEWTEFLRTFNIFSADGYDDVKRCDSVLVCSREFHHSCKKALESYEC